MIIKRDMRFTPAGKNRPLHIYLPDDYEATEARYPVMYFFDGHNLFSDADATYGKSWGFCEFFSRWEKPMIVVGMECGHEGRERLVEYCPYHFSGPFWGDLRGEGDATIRFMVEELKPMIDRELRTYAFREATGIGGSSMGGLMSLYAGIRYNRVFSKAACVSSAISPCMDDLRAQIARDGIDADTRFYLSWGTVEAGGTAADQADDMRSELARCNVEIAQRLEEKGARVHLRCMQGGRHCEADWEKLVPEFMDFLWMDR